MNHELGSSSAQSRFMRSRPGWTSVVRRYDFIGGALIFLAAYAWLVLPKERADSLTVGITVGVFMVMVLGWCAIVMTDGDKPDWLKGIVALGLVAVLGWLFYLYSGTQWDRLGSAFFNFAKMQNAWPELFKGLAVTLELAVVSAFFSILVGLVVAILRWFDSPTLNIFLIAYVDIFRSIPMIVLMVVIYFALPYLGITLVSVTATIVALSLGYGAYASESFRCGIESVHYGQAEAARALGLTRMQTMRLVILPQALRVVIPPLTGNLVAMLKDTAVASVVASPELLKRAKEVYIGKANPTSLVAAAAIYLVILVPLTRLANALENRVRAKVQAR